MPNSNQLTKPTATVLHHVPGRIRIRVPSAKGNPDRLEQFKQALGHLNEVREVTTNPALGTLIIQYDPQQFAQFPARLLEAVRQHGPFTLEGAYRANLETEVSVTDLALDRTFMKANKGVQALTGNAINFKELFPFGILLYSVLFVDKALAASQWLSWLQFAFSSYMELHQEEPVAEVAQAVETTRTQLAHQQQQSIAKLSQQLEAIHAELRALTAQNTGRQT